MLPNFIVIGAPRAGTSWIHKNLRDHPDVFVPQKKELHFFDREYDRGIAYYEEHFADFRGQRAVGEATPDYLHGSYCATDIPALIHKHLPSARLIASLRNPTERAYSRYWNAKAKFDHNRSLSFEEKLKDRPEFIREGLYADQLERYYAFFPRDQILVLLYDDLEADPHGFMRSIYSFIGVDPEFKSDWGGTKVNQAAGKKNLANSRVLYQVSRALSWAGLHRTASQLRDANSVDQPPMRAETRRWLADVYREPNRRLERLIGRDLSRWNAS